MKDKKTKDYFFLSKFKRDAFFDVACLEFNDKAKVKIKKVKSLKLFNEYVRELTTFNDDYYLLFPQAHFSTRNFKCIVDLIFFDSNFRIIELHKKVENNKNYFFNFNFYSVLVAQQGFINFNNINLQSKVKILSKSNE